MATKDYGRTRSGEPITEELLEEWVTKAEEGFDVVLGARRTERPPNVNIDEIVVRPLAQASATLIARGGGA